MPDIKIRWTKMNKSRYSGPVYTGTRGFKLSPSSSLTFADLSLAAIAKPEGGCFDTIVMYDGTAVTHGLLQWTFTSGRLHKLLHYYAQNLPSTFWYPWTEKLKDLTGLALDAAGNLLRGKVRYGTKANPYMRLRDVCTPPGGAVPRTGKNWDLAYAVAALFVELGQNDDVSPLQLAFARSELAVEGSYKRPKLGNMRINDFLPSFSADVPADCIPAAAGALFWGMWQNRPRRAEQALYSTGIRRPLVYQTDLNLLAKKFAGSAFARWGVAKARTEGYTSRYQKVASEINRLVGKPMILELWR